MNTQVSGFLLMFLIGHIAASPIQLEDGAQKKGREEDMTLIGQVGSKVFYKSVREDLMWFDAQSLCRDAGLHFAKLENREEFAYVQSQLPNEKFWTGGRLRGQGINGGNNNFLRQAFEWSDGTGLPNSASGVNFLINPSEWMCVYFYKDVLYPGSCFQGFYPAICQLSL